MSFWNSTDFFKSKLKLDLEKFILSWTSSKIFRVSLMSLKLKFSSVFKFSIWLNLIWDKLWQISFNELLNVISFFKLCRNCSSFPLWRDMFLFNSCVFYSRKNLLMFINQKSWSVDFLIILFKIILSLRSPIDSFIIDYVMWFLKYLIFWSFKYT